MRRSLLLLAVVCAARVAAADPAIPRVITAPTAWLPPGGAIVATGGAGVGAEGFGNAGEAMLSLSYGLGDLAAVELATDRDLRGCVDCTDRPNGLWLGRAGFRLGARQDAWFPGMPALVFGVRTTWAAKGPDFGGARASEAYVVASRVVGPTRIHVGASAIDARHRQTELGVTMRPLAGLEWTPRDLPRSSLMVDVAWLPRLELDRVTDEWVGGLGVRYQALTWGSIELAVRNRQDDGLAGTTVMVRLNGVWTPEDRTKKIAPE